MANTFPPFIVVGIDGTSSSSWRKPDGSNSHVYCFVRDFQYGAMGVDKLFLDGPSDVVIGRDSEPILQKALDFISLRLRTLFPRQLPAGGHSVHALEMFDVNACVQSQYYQQQYGDEYGLLPQSAAIVIPVPGQVIPPTLPHQPLTHD